MILNNPETKALWFINAHRDACIMQHVIEYLGTDDAVDLLKNLLSQDLIIVYGDPDWKGLGNSVAVSGKGYEKYPDLF